MADESQVPNEQNEEPQDNLPPVQTTIEDTGEASKKITIEVPRERIQAKFDEIFGELGDQAVVPGFRKGHAPRRLLEKRFGKEVTQDVRNALVSESLGKAVEENELQILGEPELEIEKLELPEEGNFSFSVTVEVRPEFDLPEYKGLTLTEQPVEATPERVDETVRSFLASRGVLEPVEGAAQENDVLVADVKVRGEGIEETTRENAELRVAPTALEGVPLEDFGQKLSGATPGQTVTIEKAVPDSHPTEEWRGKTITFEVTVKELKRLNVPELTDAIAAEMGFDNAQEFRNYIQEHLGVRLQAEAKQNLRNQVAEQLLEKTQLELPEKFTRRHAAQVLQRRVVDLMYNGVPREQIEENIDLLRARAQEQAQQELKLGFILDKIAEAEEIEVAEGEVNTRVAEMAGRSGRRPERVRQELAADGTLDQVWVQLREQKTVDRLLELAQVSPPSEGEAPAGESGEPGEPSEQ